MPIYQITCLSGVLFKEIIKIHYHQKFFAENWNRSNF